MDLLGKENTVISADEDFAAPEFMAVRRRPSKDLSEMLDGSGSVLDEDGIPERASAGAHLNVGGQFEAAEGEERMFDFARSLDTFEEEHEAAESSSKGRYVTIDMSPRRPHESELAKSLQELHDAVAVPDDEQGPAIVTTTF